MLLYLASAAIQHPEEIVREHQIAQEVLGRRGDFDPLTDNIVRSQMSHLRRKLETFYAEEGRLETMRIVLPKGSYLPQFQVHAPESIPTAMPAAAAPATPAVSVPGISPSRRWFWSFVGLVAVSLALLCTSIFLWSRGARQATPAPGALAAGNPFVKWLARSNGPVLIVIPDTALAVIQDTLDTSISVQDYGRKDFLNDDISRVPYAPMRDLLSGLRGKRYTSVGESAAATDFAESLSRSGLRNSLRFARDLHVRDFDEGNSVLIGSRRSNPWEALFHDRTNFQFTRNTADSFYSFVNANPLPGEASRYFPYVRENGKLSSYIDVALCSNLTHSGWVLLINGSDMQANEAAIRFLLHGTLPSSVTQILTKENLASFEIFLRGTHAEGEGEETFEVIALRSSITQ